MSRLKSILEELYFGNIDPNANYRPGREYARQMQILADSEERLLQRLEGESKALFCDFSDAQGCINGITATDKFSTGFRLGALLMVEVFTGLEEVTGK